MSNSFFTGTDAELYSGSQNFSTKISATPTAFGLTSAMATSYATLNSAYGTAYLLAVDPETRTKGNVMAKNQAKVNLKKYASDLAKIIDGTPSVTDAQKIDLGLNVRATPVPVPAPSSPPGLVVLSVSGRSAVIRLFDTASTKQRGKPPGVIGASVFSYVGTTPPPETAGWKFEGNTGRAKFQVLFPATVPAGATVYFTAFWFNYSKQSGPACNPVPTNLPGGGVSTIAA